MRVFLTLIYTYICIIITAKLSIMITSMTHEWKSEMGRVHMYLHARMMHDVWFINSTFIVFLRLLSLSHRNNDQCRNSYAQWKKKRKERKSRNFVVLHARLSYHYFPLLPFLLDVTKQNKIYTILFFD